MDIVTLGAALNGAKKQTEDYVASHFKGGANIEIVDNPDGTQTIHASGEVSSTDTVAREAIVEHVQDDDNPHKVTKSQIGLGNVDNTSDSDKPISTATQTALNAKANAVDVYTKVETDALIDSIDVPTALVDLTDDTTHRLVTDAEKTKLDGLANIKSVGVGLSLDDVTGELTATGGGTGGTTNYNDLSSKPQINSVTLSGNKSSADLGLADASDIPTALSDLTDDTTHRVVTDTEKATWNAKADTSDIAVKGIKKNNVALTPDSSSIVNITVPTTAADINALSDSTLYGASLSLEINSTTYVVTATLKDQNGNTLGTAQTIDLPLESVVVNGSYNSATKKVILTLQSGSTVEFSVADLVSGLQSEITSANKLAADLVDDSTSINKFVTSTEKSTWNGKQSALSSAQLSAVNSGIDSTKVGQISANQTEIARLVDDKSKNQLNITKTGIKSMNTAGTWSGNTYTRTDSENNLSITMNDDMSFTVNGTAATRVQFNLSNTGLGDFQNYVLSGGNVASETISVLFQEVGGSYATIGQDFGAGVELGNYDRSKSYSLSINISAGTVANNIVIKPMLCTKNSWNFSHEFTPYAPSNAELYQMLQEL